MSTPPNQEISEIRIRLTEYIRTTNETTARLNNRLAKIESLVSTLSVKLRGVEEAANINDRLSKVESYLSYLSENISPEKIGSSAKISDRATLSMTAAEEKNLSRIEAKVDKLSTEYLKNIKELNTLIKTLRGDLKKILPHFSEKEEPEDQNFLRRLGISRKKSS